MQSDCMLLIVGTSIMWMAIAFWISYKNWKLRLKICILRKALFPFALTYENIRDQKHWSGSNTVQDYKNAHKEYCAALDGE